MLNGESWVPPNSATSSDPVNLEVTAAPVDVVVPEGLLDPLVPTLGAAITVVERLGPLDEEDDDEPLANEGKDTLPDELRFRVTVGTREGDDEEDEDFPPVRAFFRSRRALR